MRKQVVAGLKASGLACGATILKMDCNCVGRAFLGLVLKFLLGKLTTVLLKYKCVDFVGM